MAKSTKRTGMARTETVFKIFRLFIKPIINEFIVPPASTENTLSRKLEMWFDKDYRDITIYRARVPFAITGPRWVSSSTPERLHIHGDGKRNVAKGEVIWVRTDARRPDVVDIEFEDQVFATRTTEWQVLIEKCEAVL